MVDVVEVYSRLVVVVVVVVVVCMCTLLPVGRDLGSPCHGGGGCVFGGTW